MYDIIIIGAGPAGMTAALYALRANKNILILEAKSYGGKIINAHKIENYPGIKEISGFDFATNLYNQIKDKGATIKYETVTKIDENRCVYTNKGTYEAKAIIIATGSENKKLNIDGEKRLIGKGISYCATCDGNFFKDKVVGVLGGGLTALDDAIYLSDIASKVYLIYHKESFEGKEEYIDRLKNKDNVEFILNTEIVKINGEDLLESVDISSNGKVDTLKLDGLFIAIGHEGKNELFSNVLDVDDHGYIITEDGVHTKTPFIYVAGDARVKELRQLTTAASDGSIAAVTAIKETK